MNAIGGAVGVCLEHPERTGVPCGRCGTFRCAECLADGYCASCRGTHTPRAPSPEDTLGFGRRAGARIIDLLVAQGVALASGVLAGVTLVVLEQLGAARAGWMQRLDFNFGFSMLAGLTSSIGGTALATWVCGATVGKALLGMRVIRDDGRRAGLGANLVREVAYLVDGFFFGLVGKGAMDASPTQQRHGDQWAGTVVVKSSTLPTAVAFPVPRLVAGLALGLFVQSLLLAAFFVIGAK